jgi:hypothetical protein
MGDLNLGDNAEGGEGLQSMMEGMMAQLMSKDILYDPLKELDTKVSSNTSTYQGPDLECLRATLLVP